MTTLWDPMTPSRLSPTLRPYDDSCTDEMEEALDVGPDEPCDESWGGSRFPFTGHGSRPSRSDFVSLGVGEGFETLDVWDPHPSLVQCLASVPFCRRFGPRSTL